MLNSRPARTGVASFAIAIAGVIAGSGLVTPHYCAAAPLQPAKSVKSVEDVKSILAPALPATAKEIAAAAATAKIGDPVTLRGYIPEATTAFNDSTAEFTLVSAVSATGVPADAARATIRILDDQGQPLKGSLNNQHGLKPGAEVFATGVVSSVGGADAIVVNAASLHVPRAPLPSGFFTDKPADNARDISEARKAGNLKVGDEVVLRGRVGGSKQPFVAGRAMFTLVGRGLKACNENAGDRCRMPWDYCCDPKSVILANSVTVQIVDDKAQTIRTDMKGRRGIKELSELVVVGKVAIADGKAVVINATSMYAVE